jgi:hypothetical protein
MARTKYGILDTLWYTITVAKLPKEVRRFFQEKGRKGGLKGGKARAAKMTPAARSAAARRAVNARWAKTRKDKGASK